MHWPRVHPPSCHWRQPPASRPAQRWSRWSCGSPLASCWTSARRWRSGGPTRPAGAGAAVWPLWAEASRFPKGSSLHARFNVLLGMMPVSELPKEEKILVFFTSSELQRTCAKTHSSGNWPSVTSEGAAEALRGYWPHPRSAFRIGSALCNTHMCVSFVWFFLTSPWRMCTVQKVAKSVYPHKINKPKSVC